MEHGEGVTSMKCGRQMPHWYISSSSSGDEINNISSISMDTIVHDGGDPGI